MIEARTMNLETPDADSPSRFEALVGPELTEALRAHPGACYAVWPDLSLAWTNPAYDSFAAANDGADIPSRWGIGADLAAALGSLRDFYVGLFEEAFTSGQRVEHSYECSSPTRKRLFRMSVMPVGESCLVLRNSCTFESAPADPPGQPSEALLAAYTEPTGRVLQCAHCRRTRRPGATEEWDWVPQLVAWPPPMTSHGLCPVCLEYHYPAR